MSFKTNYDEETTGSFIDGMARRGIPLSVFHFDCYWMRTFHLCDFEWNQDVFPDIRGTLTRFHDKGVKICAWINPYIAQGTEFFREGVKNGYLLMRADGNGVWQTDNWQPAVSRTLGRRLFRKLPIYGGDTARRAFLCHERLFLLEP